MTDVPEWSRLGMTTNTLAARLKKALNLKATEDLSQAFYNTPGVSTTGSVLVAGMEFMEKVKQACPADSYHHPGNCWSNGLSNVEKLKQADPKPYCSFAELAGIKMHTSDLMPPGEAYLIRLPDPDLSFRFNPIELPKEAYEPEDYSQIKFRIMQEYNVGLRGPRPLILTGDCWDAYVEPRVVWPEPEAPAQPLSGWQWLVIVGVLSWILCALSRAV